MALIKTWTEFLTEVKLEAKVQDTQDDANILNIANEVLVEICSSTSNLRDLRVDEVVVLAGTSTVDYTTVYLHEIEQVYYQKFSAGVFSRRWELTEANGKVIPPPITGPDAYTVATTTTLTTPKSTFTLYPIASGTVGDKLQVVGTGFKYITDANSTMPYVSFYPMIKRSILQRLQIKRNIDPNLIQMMDGSIERATSAAGLGSQDKQGNTVQS